MRLKHLTWTSVAVALALAGCASRGNLEVLESALRQQEDRLTALSQQLSTTRSELEVSQNEVSRLRTQLAQNGQQAHSPEHLENEFKAVGLRFNSYLTSGVDRDGVPGDEVLSVMLYPHDEQGGLVKLSGTVDLKAVDLSAPKGMHEIGSWRFSPAETKDAWHTGFLAAGFLFEQPLQNLPQGPDVTLHARFTTIDGRTFDAVQPLRLRTAGSAPTEAQPVLQSRASSVRSGKPPVVTAAHKPQEEELDYDAERAELEALLEKEAPDDEGEVIQTSDRYRDWDTPTIR